MLEEGEKAERDQENRKQQTNIAQPVRITCFIKMYKAEKKNIWKKNKTLE